MISWERDLEGAVTPAEIVQLARSCIAAMPREAFARLPADCRPPFIATSEDVRKLGARLNEAYWALRSASADVDHIQEAWSFFLRATVQLSRIEEEGTVS